MARDIGRFLICVNSSIMNKRYFGYFIISNVHNFFNKVDAEDFFAIEIQNLDIKKHIL